jgi:preprotein translocase subunit SecE
LGRKENSEIEMKLPLNRGGTMAVEVKTMEAKKSQQLSAASASTNAKDVPAKGWQMQDFIGDIKSEFKKITWTSPEELRMYTKIVVIAILIFGLGIYVVDLVIQGLLSVLGSVMHMIFG